MKTSIYAGAVAATLIGLASVSAQAATPANLLGTTVAPQASARTVDLASSKNYINVRSGDVVNFNANGQTFAVKFNGVRQSFDLNALAPAGALNRTVKVYVAPVREDDLS